MPGIAPLRIHGFAAADLCDVEDVAQLLLCLDHLDAPLPQSPDRFNDVDDAFRPSFVDEVVESDEGSSSSDSGTAMHEDWIGGGT